MNERPHKDRDGRVLAIPLQVLWDDRGDFGRRIRELRADDIKQLLKVGLVQFIEVNLGRRLLWVPQAERFTYWKAIRNSLYEDGKLRLEDYQGSFFLDAWEWSGGDGETIVTLERYH